MDKFVVVENCYKEEYDDNIWYKNAKGQRVRMIKHNGPLYP